MKIRTLGIDIEIIKWSFVLLSARKGASGQSNMMGRSQYEDTLSTDKKVQKLCNARESGDDFIPTRQQD